MHDNVIAFPAPAAITSPATSAGRQPTGPSIVRLPSSPDRQRQGQSLMARATERQHLAALAGGVSADISLNEELRERRREPWNRAEAMVRFRRAELDMYQANYFAHQWGLSVASALPDDHDHGASRLRLVDAWRHALIEQLLTPAPRVADLTWKRRTVASMTEFAWVGATPQQVEKVIAADEEFLRSFPARHSPNRPAAEGPK
jgi:hypothetical protein